MQEFETFIYLDVQRTGSTFISAFLKRFSSEREIFFGKHDPVKHHRPEKFHFTSVRNPLDQYLSLFSHGRGGKGEVRARIESKGLGTLYHSAEGGFEPWLEYVLSPDSAAAILQNHTHEGGRIFELVGLQSYRFLVLNIRDARRVFRKCATKDDIVSAFLHGRLSQRVIHHENFIEELVNLVECELKGAFRSPSNATTYLRNAEKMNASKRVDDSATFQISSRAMDQLREREWFLYSGLI